MACKQCGDMRFCPDCNECRHCSNGHHEKCNYGYEKSCTKCNYRRVCIYCCLCMEEHDGVMHITEKCISGGPHVNKMDNPGWFDFEFDGKDSEEEDDDEEDSEEEEEDSEEEEENDEELLYDPDCDIHST